jgi:hypothetical protein
MKRKWQGANHVGTEAPRQYRPGGSGRETKGTFRQAGQVALAMLEEIRNRKK